MEIYIGKANENIDSKLRISIRERYLRRFFGIGNSDIKRSENGKPYIEGCEYFFSISHSKNFYMFAYDKCEIGVDIEAWKTIDCDMLERLVERVMGRKDRMDSKDFLRIWTIKEAYLKFLGLGLGPKLSEIMIDNSNGIVKMEGFRDGYYVQFENDDIVYTIVSSNNNRCIREAIYEVL